MLLTGDMVTAEDAYRIGLVNRVVPAGKASEHALELARQIASKSMLTVKLGKQAFYRQRELRSRRRLQAHHRRHGREHAGARRRGRHRRLHRKTRPEVGRSVMAAPAAAMNHDAYPDSYIRGILNTVKTIAMVGISPKDNRPSYFAFKYLPGRGYRMIPVNPGQAGQENSRPEGLCANSPTSPSRSTWSTSSAPPNTCCRSCRRRSRSSQSRR